MSDAVDLILSRLAGVVRHDGHAMAICPTHQDDTPSLSITEGEDGLVLMHCFAGCEPAAILGAIGLRLADLFPGEKEGG